MWDLSSPSRDQTCTLNIGTQKILSTRPPGKSLQSLILYLRTYLWVLVVESIFGEPALDHSVFSDLLPPPCK